MSEEKNDQRPPSSEPVTAEEAIAFFNLSKDVLVICEPNGTLIKANPMLGELLGAGADAGPPLSGIHPDDIAKTAAGLAKMATGEIVEDLEEIRMLKSDGTYMWMSWHAYTEQGRMFAVGRDVSDRKSTELRLKQLAAIVDNSSDAILGIDLDHKVLTWNRGAEEAFGHSVYEAVGADINDLLGSSAAGAIPGWVGQAPREAICHRKDGSVFTGDISVSVVKDDAESVVGYSVIVRDVSERKEMERRVREFYSTVSHELRTPLTSIRAALGLLQSETVETSSDEGRDLVEMARSSSDRLIRLINDILDIQKVESGRMDIATAKLSVSDVVEQACADVAALADDLGVRIKKATNSSAVSVRGNRDRTIQILTNLLSNAIKFSGQQKVVQVDTTAGAAGVRFSVSDAGPGIPEHQAHKLFQKFQQLDSSDSRLHGGTGLGLAISKALVEEQGGTIGYYNNDSRGCTFWFELPIWS